MPDEPLEPGPLPISTALPASLAKSSSESSSEESSSESSSEEEEEEEEESESSDSEEERAHRLAELQEQVLLSVQLIKTLLPFFALFFFSWSLRIVLLDVFFAFHILILFFLSSFGQYMNNWLPCPKAQYPSPSGRERKKRKRRNGRQRSIEAELG